MLPLMPSPGLVVEGSEEYETFEIARERLPDPSPEELAAPRRVVVWLPYDA